MGHVVVVVVVVLDFKTFTHISRDPTLKKVLYAKSAPMSDRSWQGVKTFFGVGSPNHKGSNPEESFTREVTAYVRDVLAEMLILYLNLSARLDPS